jgi:cysteine desulfurase
LKKVDLNLIQYLDSASSTKVDQRVLDAMLPYFTEYYGNASSNHIYGEIAKKAIEKARGQVAEIINADSKEIYFTSGATEAINWALKGFLEANPEKGNHIITVKTEHKAVLNTCAYLETKGYEVTYLEVDEKGLISMLDLQSSINENTSMICVMYVNNEIGIIQPIKEVGKIARKNDVTFFCDATQAVGKVPVDVVEENIDLLCFSAHKMNGPKGVGALYIKNGLKLEPLLHGGGQEIGLRSGTYNTPLIVGFGVACKININEYNIRIREIEKLRDQIIERIKLQQIGKVNFYNNKRAPHIISISLDQMEAQEYLMKNELNFVASHGSACNSSLLQNSHVLKALGIKNQNNHIRISLQCYH